MASSGRESGSASLVVIASVCAFAIIATQVAGKAARDALFLTYFDISALPLVLIASALVSIGAVLGTARSMTVLGPARAIPPWFFASAVLLAAEWLLAMRYPRPAAVVIYLHIAVIGSILISGFWSIINESFDPRSAKRTIGRIVGGATIGGLFGGFLADQVGSRAGVLAVLPIVAGLHLVCALLLMRFRHGDGAADAPPLRSWFTRARRGHAVESGFRALKRVGYLRNLAVIVLLGNAAATLIDFMFKARAAETFTTSAELVRFFAVFYTAVSVVTLIVQAGMTRRLLERIGIANLVAVRPAVMVVGGLATLPVLGLVGLGILRGVEGVLQSSLFRSGYELLFLPVVPKDKRATKTIVDVGADRMGDVLGGAITRAVIFLPMAVADHILVLLAVVISIAGFVVARALRRGYVRALEASLIDRANVLDIKEDEATGTSTTLMESFTGLDLSMSGAGIRLDELRAAVRSPSPETPAPDAEVDPSAPQLAPAPIPAADPEIASLVALRSGDARRVHAELRHSRGLTPGVAAQVIALLAWDEVTGWASRALAKAAPSITGQLVDRLLDPNEDFAIRRRIPRILGTCATPRSYDGLLAALADKRFEVRFQCGRALARINEMAPSLVVDKNAVYAAVLQETRVEKALWQSQRLIDDPAVNDSLPIDETLRARASRSMEHVFTLLSLVLPRAPLQIAFKGLLTSDAVLRGTSLEYLESVLPREIWTGLSPLLDESGSRAASARPREEVLEELLRSNQSIELNLEELRNRIRSE
ncbi:MAG TPA: Npt1/Npt2 family nucleotide transporter [Candidatus Krumholzibacteria bacterium]|nr:Npt1/Npt2 family nucleotide transporter [Candidatus Krumholzibacteria bacterium]